MIGRRRGASHASADAPTEDSVWATDVLPTSEPVTEFDWAATRSPDPRIDPDSDSPESEPARVGKTIGAAVAAALLLAAVAIVLWPNSNEPGVDNADDTDAPPATLSDLPLIDPSLPATTVSPEIEDDPTNVGDVALPALDALDPEFTAGADAPPTSIDVPPALAAMTRPTEVVMLTDDELVTLSLPSGNVRYTELDSPNTGNLMVGEDSAAFTSSLGDLVIAPRIGAPITVDFSSLAPQGFFPRGWSRAEDGASLYQFNVFTDVGFGTEFIVDSSGNIVEPADAIGSSASNPADLLRTNGRRLVNDAGGVYEIDLDGNSVRIADGIAYATNGDFMVLRTCDVGRRCGFVVENRDTGERRVIDGSVAGSLSQFDLDLAPTGDAFASNIETVDGTRRVIVDLDLGVIAEASENVYLTSGSRWTADGSAYFFADRPGGGVTFFDRATGESIDFATELSRNIREFGVRYPDAELPAEPAVGTIRLSEPLSVPTGLDLVVLGAGDRLAYVDVDAGTAGPWAVPELSGASPAQIFVNGLEVIVTSGSSGFVSTFGAATAIEGLPLADSRSPRLQGPLPGLVWAPTATAGDGVDHRLVVLGQLPAIDGSEVSVDNSTLLGSDGNGGLVAEVGGDVFAVSAEGSSRLTSGDLLALNGRVVLERNCLDDLTCSVNIVDRTTGTTNPVSDEAVGSALPVTGARSVHIAGTIAPDATAFVIQRPDDGPESSWSIVDLRSQTVVAIPPPEATQPLIWNDLSTYMAFVSRGSVYIYDRTNARISLVEGLGTVRSVASVSADFAPAN